MAHIFYVFFLMDSLIIFDRVGKIFLYASEFIRLPLSVTSCESTEPVVPRQPRMLQSMHVRCFTGEKCALFTGAMVRGFGSYYKKEGLELTLL